MNLTEISCRPEKKHLGPQTSQASPSALSLENLEGGTTPRNTPILFCPSLLRGSQFAIDKKEPTVISCGDIHFLGSQPGIVFQHKMGPNFADAKSLYTTGNKLLKEPPCLFVAWQAALAKNLVPVPIIAET
jgi:hypothetical protein